MSAGWGPARLCPRCGWWFCTAIGDDSPMDPRTCEDVIRYEMELAADAPKTAENLKNGFRPKDVHPGVET